MITSSGSSSFVLINRGVPQGRVLGPLLFNIYVSHLPDIAVANASTLLLFAHGKTLYSAHKSIAAAAQVTTDALSALSEALDALGLCINSSKTSSMFILPSQVEGNVCECITYSGSPLEIVSCSMFRSDC